MFGAILGLAGGGMSAFGSYAGGMAQRKTAEYNARVMRQRAQMVEQASRSETTRAHKEARKLKATQQAGFAKSGAMLTSGTPLMVLAEQAGEMERDILEQRRNRMIEAQGLRSQAEMLKIQGKQASTAGKLGAVTALLGAGAGAAGSFGGFGGGSVGSGSVSAAPPMAGMPINRSYGVA